MSDLRHYAQAKEAMRKEQLSIRKMVAHTPLPEERDAPWITIPVSGPGSIPKFLATRAYLRGALDAQSNKGHKNPFRPGPELAQYNYGYANELAGFHDDLDLPFERLTHA